jgi:hypothetical protein
MVTQARADAGGDVEMVAAQPAHEYVRAPRLEEWSQLAVTLYARDWAQYGERIRER